MSRAGTVVFGIPNLHLGGGGAIRLPSKSTQLMHLTPLILSEYKIYFGLAQYTFGPHRSTFRRNVPFYIKFSSDHLVFPGVNRILQNFSTFSPVYETIKIQL